MSRLEMVSFSTVTRDLTICFANDQSARLAVWSGRAFLCVLLLMTQAQESGAAEISLDDGKRIRNSQGEPACNDCEASGLKDVSERRGKSTFN
jgi:hypothetical protein